MFIPHGLIRSVSDGRQLAKAATTEQRIAELLNLARHVTMVGAGVLGLMAFGFGGPLDLFLARESTPSIRATRVMRFTIPLIENKNYYVA